MESITEREEKAAGLRPALPWFAGEERGDGLRGLAFAVEEDVERGKGGAEFTGAEEMSGVAGSFGAGKLEFGEGFVEEMAAGTEGEFEVGEEVAVEIVETEEEIKEWMGTDGEASFPGEKRQPFLRRGEQAAALHRREVGCEEQDAGEMIRDRGELCALNGDVSRGGEGCGAVEG